MKTEQEREQKENENMQMDAELLIEKMLDFIPYTKGRKGSFGSAKVSAKFCAINACDYLIHHLPNINDTPPIHRKSANSYSQYWRGVKFRLDLIKYKS